MAIDEESQQQAKRIKTFSSSENRHLMPTLPPEIVIEILLRLPVKCLLRCKSACKSWYSLTSNPNFVKSHLSFSTSRNDYAHHRIMLIEPTNTVKSCPIYDVMHDKPVNSLEVDYPLKDDLNFVRPLNNSVNFVRIVGACNGLLCLIVGSDSLFICNPSTRRWNRLSYCGFGGRLYGFGYDESSEDYKVVAISDILRHETRVKMYSLKTAKWKEIGDFPRGILVSDSSAFSNGAIHWAVKPNFASSSLSTIVLLDLATETCGEVLQPVYDEGNMHLKLGILGEWLCLLCGYRESHVDLWVMKVYGVQESWTKLVSIHNLDFNLWRSSFPCFANDGKSLWRYGRKLVLFDVKNGTSSVVKNYGGSHEVMSWTIVESLVSPGGPMRHSCRRGRKLR